MQTKVGLITIGQSPRVDMTPEMQAILGNDIQIVEAGALDGLTREEIAALAPQQDEATYVSRLTTGESVKLSKKLVTQKLQEKITEIEPQVSSIIIACTGNFPSFQHEKLILYPDRILRAVVNGLIDKQTLGIIVPLPEQKETLKQKWDGITVLVESASPYADDDFIAPAKALRKAGASMIVLDCMGYTEEHRKIVQEASNLPVILSRSIVARVAAELA